MRKHGPRLLALPERSRHALQRITTRSGRFGLGVQPGGKAGREGAVVRFGGENHQLGPLSRLAEKGERLLDFGVNQIEMPAELGQLEQQR
jgi:hypothetical protein